MERAHRTSPPIHTGGGMSEPSSKAEAILDAIRKTDVGSDIIIQNEDMSIFCIMKIKCKEHPENLDEDGGKVIKP